MAYQQQKKNFGQFPPPPPPPAQLAAAHNQRLNAIGLTPQPVVWNRDDTFFQRYQLKSRLGGGSFGDVYIVTETNPQKLIGKGTVLEKESQSRAAVIKALNPGTRPQDLDAEVRLLRGAKQDANTCNPGIVCIVDNAIVTFPDGSIRAIILYSNYSFGKDMEALVKSVIAAKTPLKPDRLREMLISALSALAKLHQKGIAHRDIKPANLYLNGNKVTVLDLGLSCFTTQWKNSSAYNDLCVNKGISGSPHYMSAEQWSLAQAKASQDEKTAFAGDIYSLAFSFYPLATAREGPSNMLYAPDAVFDLYPADPVISRLLYEMLAPQNYRPTAEQAVNFLIRNDKNSQSIPHYTPPPPPPKPKTDAELIAETLEKQKQFALRKQQEEEEKRIADEQKAAAARQAQAIQMEIARRNAEAAKQKIIAQQQIMRRQMEQAPTPMARANRQGNLNDVLRYREAQLQAEQAQKAQPGAAAPKEGFFADVNEVMKEFNAQQVR